MYSYEITYKERGKTKTKVMYASTIQEAILNFKMLFFEAGIISARKVEDDEDN